MLAFVPGNLEDVLLITDINAMPMIGKKRVSAKEAAEFLGVPYANISRIDKQGEYIKRYKLGHKTHVYDLESLEAFLEAKRVKPLASPGPARVSPGRKPPLVPVRRERRLFLLDYLPAKEKKK